MRATPTATMFELTTIKEMRCYAKLKDYFDGMYFAN